MTTAIEDIQIASEGHEDDPAALMFGLAALSDSLLFQAVIDDAAASDDGMGSSWGDAAWHSRLNRNERPRYCPPVRKAFGAVGTDVIERAADIFGIYAVMMGVADRCRHANARAYRVTVLDAPDAAPYSRHFPSLKLAVSYAEDRTAERAWGRFARPVAQIEHRDALILTVRG